MAEKTVDTRILDYQAEISERLKMAVLKDRVGQAYLFSGPEGSGKEAMAIEFARLMNCTSPGQDDCGPCRSCIRFKSLQHEHLYFVVPMPASAKKVQGPGDDITLESDVLNEEIQEKARDHFHKINIPKANRILIASVRELRKKLYLKSLEEGRKVVLIFDAHRLTEGQGEAANALLKILEEPPRKTTIILVTDHKSKLFQTLVSRCQQVNFPPLSAENLVKYLEHMPAFAGDVHLTAGLSQGNLHKARLLAKMDQEELRKHLRSLVKTFEDDSADAIRNFVQTLGKTGFSDRDQYRFSLTLLQLWFKSVNACRIRHYDDLYEAGYGPSLESFNRKYPRADYTKIIKELEEAVSAPDRNLYLPLVLVNTAIRITKALDNEVYQ